MISECSLPRQIFACYYVDLLLSRERGPSGSACAARRSHREMKWEVNDVESRRRLLPFPFSSFRLYNLQQRQQRGKSNPFGDDDFGSSSPSAPVTSAAAVYIYYTTFVTTQREIDSPDKNKQCTAGTVSFFTVGRPKIDREVCVRVRDGSWIVRQLPSLRHEV